jgi:hypothetical protein
MMSLTQFAGRLPLKALVLALGICGFSGPAAVADDGGFAGPLQVQKCEKCGMYHDGHSTTRDGTQGCGGPGVISGFQGFGRGCHLRYGYGGDALGVGADGGYPFYGGPGYPHPWPCLRRCGGITPFPYFGGPGYPSPGNPNYFGGVGPLVANQPVIAIGTDQGGIARGYGAFTGTLPYPEAVFASFTAAAAAGGSSSGAPTSPATAEIASLPVAGRSLGIDTEPVVDAGGVRGLKVSKVYPGSAAEKAGLHAGDVIQSINGYLTLQSGHVAWIIANAAPNNVLKMSVLTASDGKVHTLAAYLP